TDQGCPGTGVSDKRESSRHPLAPPLIPASDVVFQLQVRSLSRVLGRRCREGDSAHDGKGEPRPAEFRRPPGREQVLLVAEEASEEVLAPVGAILGGRFAGGCFGGRLLLGPRSRDAKESEEQGDRNQPSLANGAPE